MDLNKQKFNRLYDEYINDNNLIIMAIDIISKMGISTIKIDDISYFIYLFKKYYSDYNDNNIKESLEKFINNNTHILAHCPNDKYIVGSRDNIDVLKNINDIDGVYNHYNMNEIEDEYISYLKK